MNSNKFAKVGEKNDKLVRVHKKLVEEINIYRQQKYGGQTSFTQASLNYAIDMRTIRERLNSKGGNNFL